MTTSTRAQLEMGATISKDVKDAEDLDATARTIFKRDKDWLGYHAATLAALTANEVPDSLAIEAAGVERDALQLMRGGHYDKAISRIEKFCAKTPQPEKSTRSWLLQMAARASECWGDPARAMQFQQIAYALNHNLTRPKVLRPYTPIAPPSKQAEELVALIDEYAPRRGVLAHFAEVTSFLTPESSSNQFEQSLMELGSMLGFASQRPENDTGQGPDVLWLLQDGSGVVIEAKSRKKPQNALSKDNLGQLLTSVEWFKDKYVGSLYVAVSVHPTNLAAKSIVTSGVRVLTYDSLNALVADAKALVTELAESALSSAALRARCQQLLDKSPVASARICSTYMKPFKQADDGAPSVGGPTKAGKKPKKT